MSIVNWIRIIIFILTLIAEGMSKDDAISKASERFGVTIDDIKRHM